MNNEQKLQELSGFDAVSLFGLITISLAIVWGLVVHGMTAQRLTDARIGCDQIAIQILSSQNVKAGRIPASNPDFRRIHYSNTKDPWGHRYAYRVLTDRSGRQVVAVFSAGPNGKFDTTNHDFLTDRQGRFLAVHFQGDDIGTVQKSWP